MRNIISKKILENLGVEVADYAFLNKVVNFGGKIIEFVNDTLQHEKLSLKPTRELIRKQYLSLNRVNVYIDD